VGSPRLVSENRIEDASTQIPRRRADEPTGRHENESVKESSEGGRGAVSKRAESIISPKRSTITGASIREADADEGVRLAERGNRHGI